MQKVIPHDAVLVPDVAQRVFEGKIFDVYQWPQTMYDGSEHTFEMLKRTDTVTAICVVDDKVLVLDDEQPHMGKRESFPGGRVDPEDESTEAAVQREILEETGYSFQNWRLIKVSQPYRKIEWFVYVFLAWEPTDQTDTKHDAGEKITVKAVDFTELKGLVLSRTGYLAESQDIFENVNNLDQLLAAPEFSGQVVER